MKFLMVLITKNISKNKKAALPRPPVPPFARLLLLKWTVQLDTGKFTYIVFLNTKVKSW